MLSPQSSHDVHQAVLTRRKMKATLQAIADTILFYGISIPLTHFLTVSGVTLWTILPLGLGLILRARDSKAASKAKQPSPLDGFNLVKVISSIAALVIVNTSQLGVLPHSFMLVAFVLAVNMLEAVVTDLQIDWCRGWANALVGLILIATLPMETQESYDKDNLGGGYFLFPLSDRWIIMYTLWNAAFVYGVGFAWSFRLILLSPLVVSYGFLGDSRTWLGARTYSLVLNQLLRGSKALHIFSPGKSYITKRENEPSVHNLVRVLFGLTNLLVLILVF